MTPEQRLAMTPERRREIERAVELYGSDPGWSRIVQLSTMVRELLAEVDRYEHENEKLKYELLKACGF